MMMKLKAYRGLLLVLAFALVIIAALEFLPYEVTRPLVKEKGPIENITVLLYFCSVITSLWIYFKNYWDKAWIASVLLFLMGARELDAHVKFTTMNFAKTRFFISPKVPMIEKFWVSVFLLALLALLIYFIRVHWKSFWQAISGECSYAYTTLFTFVLIPGSKLLDSTPKIMRDHFHIPVDKELRLVTTIVEEVAELAIPLLFLIAMWQYLKLHSKPREIAAA